MNDVVGISGELYSNFALKCDGSVWDWGKPEPGYNGNLNINITSIKQIEGLNDIVTVYMGFGYTFALKRDSTVWSWGTNTNYGQLGDGTKERRDSPIMIPGLKAAMPEPLFTPSPTSSPTLTPTPTVTPTPDPTPAPSQTPTPSPENDLTSRMSNAIALYVGSPKAFVKNEETYVDTSNHDVAPLVKNGRTLVPVRFISENFGGTVDWNSATSTATLTFGEKVVKLTVGSNNMYVDDKEVTLDVPAESINGRIMIPLRALVEDALGKKVFYDRNLIIVSDTENIIDSVSEKQMVDEVINWFK